MELLLDHWDLLLLTVVSSALLVFITVAEALSKADLWKGNINYAAVTTYAVLSGLVLFSTSTLREKLDDEASVEKFLTELARVSDNRFAQAKLQQLRPMLEEFKDGQVNTGTTQETIANLVRAFEEANSGMHIIVVNPRPVFGIEESGNLRSAEEAAIRRGASVTHIDVKGAQGGRGYELPAGRIDIREVDYAQVSQLESFRLHGSGSVFSFGKTWFAEVNIVQSGVGESARGRILWGSPASALDTLVSDVARMAAAGVASSGSTDLWRHGTWPDGGCAIGCLDCQEVLLSRLVSSGVLRTGTRAAARSCGSIHWRASDGESDAPAPYVGRSGRSPLPTAL